MNKSVVVVKRHSRIIQNQVWSLFKDSGTPSFNFDATAGKITVFGVQFSADSSTRFEDKSDQKIVSFDLADIAAGDFVEVKAFDRGNNDLYASKIERDNSKSENELQDVVQTIGTDTLTILGIAIETDTNTNYEDIDETSLDKAAFFGKLATGDLVKAKGTKTQNGSLLAKRLSFETPED